MGVLRAIGELGIPIDAIGGTSMRAIIAALYALDSRIEEMSAACKFGFVEQGPLLDFTFPAVALTAGKRIADRLERFFGDTQIEDLWLRFFCVSSNLSQAEMMVHRNGQL